MLLSRAVTGFAGYARGQTIQLQFAANDCARTVAAEAISRFVSGDVPSKGYFQTGRWIQDIANRPIKVVYGGVITYSSFI